ncbi:MAG: rhodanese-like domain-containing protein [Rhizobiales bacterium]|nr:rhodanese-like domain-containing protein [Hyphomicrobiales bacterium]MBO6698113.1 rhodanese-like domain-containing protein [Hyphomicrobiales bacterium]MBO6735633.1 rhodanese-like domain-containing protein [Hyphomicrobiales bacterium]MBO6910559.1 rhodanese-like domain-containing protein [Hyphomicrobiales bacterium]MBO6957138.1 rhodanese-like domain-containing protein [Hyphomicrobiales bacterium]
MTDATDSLPSPGKAAQLVAEADAAVGHITAEAAKTLLENEESWFIDVRDVRELAKTGRIPGAKHCPRGMLEFWIDPQSPYHKPLFAEEAQFVFYCASGWRSALAAQTAKMMGLDQVTHLKGGISAWIDAGLPVEQR